MRVRDVLVLGALTIGAMGCGDSLAPPASEGRDLEFVLPAAKGVVPAVRYRTWNEPVSASDIAIALSMQQASVLDETVTGGEGEGEDGGAGGDEAFLPWIISAFATGVFEGNLVMLRYGFFGFGSGYTITPEIKVYSASGDVLLEQNRVVLTEDAPVYAYMRPTVEDPFVISEWCGATGQLKVQFEVRVGVPILGVSLIGKTQAIRSQIFMQRPCDPPPEEPTDGGTGAGASSGGGLWLCFLDLWLDENGNIIDGNVIACHRIGGSNLIA